MSTEYYHGILEEIQENDGLFYLTYDGVKSANETFAPTDAATNIGWLTFKLTAEQLQPFMTEYDESWVTFTLNDGTKQEALEGEFYSADYDLGEPTADNNPGEPITINSIRLTGPTTAEVLNHIHFD